MATARYGGYLRASLPPFWPTTDAAAVRAALTRLVTGLEAPHA
jgi:ATP-dependent DNA helicase DinG